MSKKIGKVLIIDDNEDILLAGHLFLKQYFSLVHTEKNPNQIPSLLKNENYDVILLDMNFARDVTSGMEGFYWLDKILEIDPSAVVVLITAFGDVEMAVKAIKKGATDFVLKPWQNEKLLATLSSAMNLRRSLLEVDRLRSRQKQLSADLDQRFHDMIGVCPQMQKVFSTIRKVAKTDANILIMGENGTGKELVARALHRQSDRSNEVFISVDIGTITETLFESELFGSEKGAFTDAKESRPGRFEVACDGTLFLDEIGNLSLAQQAKLLRVLETRQVTRIGSNKVRDIDIRLICATNMPIYDMVTKKEFRQDLLYRINTVEIKLPPLRERQEDIPLLVDHFLSIFSKKYKKNIKRVSSSASTKLQKFHWPGNIRELRHTIERTVILSERQALQPIDFLLPETREKEEEIAFDNYNLEDVEKTIVRKALIKHNGNVTHAAGELGLTRTSLYRRMEKYGL
ncbi:sigma-54 dependent transcriptional regulator [bacterium]|nr:sigma-54 dependent transcriptional regulator [bacterium]MBU1634403.1 sigma-54 dependent transcriptional regulator [bacterium]MBU1873864.1 sigma-54 dependent transcriptional regulator [bacterium]